MKTRRVSRASKEAAQKAANSALLKQVRSVQHETKKKVEMMARRESRVSDQLDKLYKKLTRRYPSALSEATVQKASAIDRSITRKISLSDANRVKRIKADLKNVHKSTLIFRERARLAADKKIPAADRIKLLKEMEDALNHQESWIKRLQRGLSDPKVWIALGIVALGGYFAYQVPHILREVGPAAKAVGDAAEQAGLAADQTLNASNDLAATAGCLLFASFSNFVPLIGTAIGASICGAAVYNRIFAK